MKVLQAISVILYFVGITACVYNEDYMPNTNVWPTAHPSLIDLDADRLLAMDSAIEVHANQGITSVVVVKDGHLAFENYYHDNDRNSLFALDNVSASISNLAIGVAIDMGLINSVDEPIHSFLPDFADEFEQFPLKKEITFEHLMNMKSGLSWNEFGGAQSDVQLIATSEDWIEYLVKKPLDARPGQRFTYNSATAIVIASAIENQYGGSYQTFLRNEVFEPLGISSFEISTVNGNLNAAWGISLGTLDLAKIGFLFLNQGEWFGSEFLNSNFAASSVAVQTNVDYSNDFGWMWWRYADNFNFLSTLTMNDAYFVAGDGNQRLYVIPHIDLVVAITGESDQPDFVLSAPLILRDYVIDAIQ